MRYEHSHRKTNNSEIKNTLLKISYMSEVLKFQKRYSFIQLNLWYLKMLGKMTHCVDSR